MQKNYRDNNCYFEQFSVVIVYYYEGIDLIKTILPSLLIEWSDDGGNKNPASTPKSLNWPLFSLILQRGEAI